MNDQQRDEFEVALAARLANYYPAAASSITDSLRKMRDGDSYTSMSVTGNAIALAAKHAWWAWKESLARVVVELPDPSADDPDDKLLYGVDAISACRAAIEAAGVKVAP